jgi:3-methyladenine DNA glycosylase AlkC
MLAWAGDPSEHVRRLASEGCRPRLPWGMGLPQYKRDPTPILPILERLRADPSDYVRRSVANNLNDISKDHPDQVLAIAGRWLGEHAATEPLVKHACRSLLKRGDQRALALFGQHDVVPVRASLRLTSARVVIGDRLGFVTELRCDASTAVRIEYRIDYVNRSGGVSQRTFKIGERQLQAGRPLRIERTQRFTDFSTRKHYPGAHRIAIVVNGVERARRRFMVAVSE